MYGMFAPQWKKHVARASSVVLALFVTNGAMAAGACRTVEGKFESQVVSGPACLSSVDLCTQGTVSGDLKGSFSFVGTSLIPTVDTPTTAVVLATGDTTLATLNGRHFLKSAALLRTSGDEDFSELDTIVGGTDRLAGATGTLHLDGTFDQLTGGVGRYVGRVCLP